MLFIEKFIYTLCLILYMKENKNQSTSSFVKEYLDNNPILIEYLQEGLINLSALNRKLLPLIKKVNSKATFESVLIAIQRNIPKVKFDNLKKIDYIINKSEVSLTNNITQIIFKKGNIDEKIFFDLMKKRGGDGVCIFAETRSEINLFISNHLLKEFKSIINFGEIHEKELSVLGIHETTMDGKFSSIEIPGYLANLCLKFSQKNISIVEIISVHSQILFFLNEKDSIKAYEMLIERN